jgi:hypothetical protein
MRSAMTAASAATVLGESEAETELNTSMNEDSFRRKNKR